MQLPKLQPIDANKPKKKKILLLGDDFRLPSGIGTISRQIVLKTVDKFDWVQLGAALKHPEHGKGVDISPQVQQETGVADADVKIIPWSGYGDRNILFSILNQEKPDIILHFTDPRYWTWLYAIEHEIKSTYGTPIAYYAIWDDLPYPMWNAPFYGSCDMVMGISNQSDNIHREVLKQNEFDVYNYDNKETKDNGGIITGYIPHGLDHEIFKPLPKDDERYKKMYEQIKTNNQVDFVVFWNNRNVRRKQPGDVVLAFKTFTDTLTPEQRNKTMLLMHTTPVDNNGTDLRSVAKNIAPECKVLFSDTKLSPEDLNAMYNVSDVVVNIASNEGWGLSSTEAMLSGTPIINNVTGGLQDQCGFLEDGPRGKWIRFNREFPTNHTGKFKTHGVWVKPVFPASRSLQGSPQTPYIFDDRCKFEDVADAIHYWYSTKESLRIEYGQAGRDFCLAKGLTAESMSNKIAEMIEYLIDRGPSQRPRYTFKKVTETKYENIGITQ